jgi:NAD(P)-dependent dehydrogenase (short-subunit alcohol dehydrogenase family)
MSDRKNAMSERKLEGRTAIVTGAGGGLGLECAHLLARHGASVAILDIDAEAGMRAAESIRDAGGEAMAAAIDVSSEEAVGIAVAAVVERYGRIDILHNNAAILSDEQRAGDRDVCSMDVTAWDRAFAVNARGSMLMSKYVLPHMLQRGTGSLIHSSSGFSTQGDLSLTAYGASKAAVNQLSRSIATQYGKRGIRSNVVQIGLVRGENSHPMPTELLQIILDGHLTPTLGVPRNIADVVLFLAGDDSAFITGHTLVVDGGFSAHMPTTAALQAYFERLGSNKI